jgi:hypothetical protein
MEFFVNGQPLPPAVLPVQDVGARLVHAEKEFTPSGPGVYQIQVRAIDSVGNTGPAAWVTVTVSGEAEPAPPEEEPIETEPAVEEEPPAEEAPQEPPAPLQEVTVSFYADPASVEAGSGCTTLHWDVVGTENVYLNGSFVYFKGMEEQCNLCESETHKLQVVKPDGSSEDHWATINVNGSCSAPAEEPPPGDVVEPDPLDVEEPDKMAPIIVSTNISPSSIWHATCPNDPKTAISTINVYDNNGISYVKANWSVGGKSGVVNYSSSDGTNWTGQFKDIQATGTMTINGVVADTADPVNTTEFVHSITVKNCLE